MPPHAADAAELLGVPCLGGLHLILGHLHMDVVRDDRDRDRPVVAIGHRILAATVDRESEIGRELVVEQLDTLAFR